VHRHLVERALLDKTEVIVVTADGPDGTAQLAKASLAQFPHATHLEPGAKVGKGRDVRAGMLAARGDLVVFMDADLATPLHHLDALLEMLDDSDLVIGYRDLGKIHDRWERTISSQLANRLVQATLLPGIHDTQCGFKGFRRATVEPLFEPLVTMGWGFDFEVIARAKKLGYRTQQLPLPDWRDPKGDEGLAGEVPWLARLRTLRELLLVWRRLR
jgi:dolichyl-phosphate beta-glucosyltransferase